MIRIALVIREPSVRQLLDAALQPSKSEPAGFDVRRSQSLGDAVPLVDRCASALLLFDYHELTNAVLVEVRHFHRAAPACIACAISTASKVYLSDARALQSAGARFFLDESTIRDGKALTAYLRTIAANLSGSRVLAFLQPILPASALGAARVTLATVCEVTSNDLAVDARSRRRRTRRQLGPRPPVSAEREDIAVRLLLLTDLVETTQRPVSALYDLAAFPTAKDAGQLLRSYAAVDARELASAVGRDRARVRLVQILLGQALPERRRVPREPDAGPA